MGNFGHVARDFQVVDFYFHVGFFVFAPVVFVFCCFFLSPFYLCFFFAALGIATRVFPAHGKVGRTGRSKEQEVSESLFTVVHFSCI